MEQVVDERNKEIEMSDEKNHIHSAIHYLSTMAGVALTLFFVGLAFLLPRHNILEEPEYWYELDNYIIQF